MEGKIIDLTESTLKHFVESIRPVEPEIRAQIDFGYSYDGKNIEIFEIRPFMDDPSEIIKSPFAKIRFNKTKRVLSLYWKRANDTWEHYKPHTESTHLEDLLKTIAGDKTGCFFG